MLRKEFIKMLFPPGGDILYKTKILAGRGYTVEYPEFEGESLANRFYEHLGQVTEEYFFSLTDDRYVCRAAFTVEDADEYFTVEYTLTIRRCGKRCGTKTIAHKWQRWQGRDAVIVG